MKWETRVCSAHFVGRCVHWVLDGHESLLWRLEAGGKAKKVAVQGEFFCYCLADFWDVEGTQLLRQ